MAEHVHCPSLSSADLELHRKLGITADKLARKQVMRVSDADARNLLALNNRPGSLAGLLYPYLDPADQRIVTRRLRRDQPEYEQGKPKNKYISGYGDRRHLYFGCDTAASLSDPAIVAVIVEAEKSALAADCAAAQLGRPVLAIALGGCWGWRGRTGKAILPDGGTTDECGPLPDFDRVAWRDRTTVLAFDANAAANAKVQAARRGLGLELTRRGARVHILELPLEEGVNGPDDFIGRHGPERFFALVDAAPTAMAVDHIFRLNQDHAVVVEAGRTIVVTEIDDPVLGRQVLTRSSFNDFRNLYLREHVPAGADRTGHSRTIPLGHLWLAHPDRRQYDGVVMAPGQHVPGYLNLWRGFAVRPTPGSFARYAAHLQDVICRSDPTLYRFVWGWLADAVQHPDRPAGTALVLRGQRGTGKGLFVRPFGELFGQHYLQIANTKHLTGHFNSHLQDTVVLFSDEAIWAGDRAGESVLKMLITEPVIPIERKGRDVVLAKNFLHIVLASNHEWVIPAGLDERRFCVLDVDATHQGDHDYFAALVDELDHGGRAALLDALLAYDLEGVNLRAAPETEALRQQKILTLLPNERWLFDKLMAGKWLPDHEGWVTEVSKAQLHADYIERLQKIGVERRSTETELGMFLTRIFGDDVTTIRKQFQGRQENERGWQFANLEVCRTDFDGATHSHHPWPEGE